MIKCPQCFSAMEMKLLDDRVPAHKCSSCEGIWISSSEYANWIEGQKATSSESVTFSDATPLPEIAARKPMLCVDCGRILKRYKIWPNVAFYLDRCGSCNGIWFDKNEWDVLVQNHLTKQLTMFFSYEWQKKLKKEEMVIRLQELYLERFGEVDYSKLKEVHEWIYSNANRDQLIAFLMDKNPFES